MHHFVKTIITIFLILNLDIYAQDKNYSPVPKKENALHKAIKTAINGMSELVGFGEIKSCPIPEFLRPTPPPEPPQKELTPEQIAECNRLLLPAPKRKYKTPEINLIKGGKLSPKKSILVDGVDLTSPEQIARIQKLIDDKELDFIYRQFYSKLLAAAKKETNPEFSELNMLRNVRVGYHDMLEREKLKLTQEVKTAKDPMEVAKKAWLFRREAGRKQKAATPFLSRLGIYSRNFFAYKDIYGPSFKSRRLSAETEVNAILKSKEKEVGKSEYERLVANRIIDKALNDTNKNIDSVLINVE